MKLFYGVQGTGNGHISRARAMSNHLQAKSVDTQYLFSGRRREHYFDMDPFGDWLCKDGLSFVTHKGRVKPLQTLRRNNLWRFYRDVISLDLRAYDLVVSDFEPITAWAARRQGIPCITLGHQYAFNHAIPTEGGSSISRSIMKIFAPGRESLGLHWHHFEQPILPPIIDVKQRPLTLKDDQVLVYLGFESPEQVIPLLQQFPQQRFVYYGEFPAMTTHNNVTLQPLSVKGFKRDLAQSKGVICNAGFELASEALHLGKRLLVKPLHGQMEQLSNALALETLGLGQRMDTLCAKAIGNWLQQSSAPECHYPDVAEAVVNWLMDDQRCSVDALSKQLWDQTQVTTASKGSTA